MRQSGPCFDVRQVCPFFVVGYLWAGRGQWVGSFFSERKRSMPKPAFAFKRSCFYINQVRSLRVQTCPVGHRQRQNISFHFPAILNRNMRAGRENDVAYFGKTSTHTHSATHPTNTTQHKHIILRATQTQPIQQGVGDRICVYIHDHWRLLLSVQ